MVALPTPARDATSSIDIPAMPRSASSSSAAAMMARSACSLRGRPRCGAAPSTLPAPPAPTPPPTLPAPATPPALLVLTGSPSPLCPDVLCPDVPGSSVIPASLGLLASRNSTPLDNVQLRGHPKRTVPYFYFEGHHAVAPHAGRVQPITVAATNVPACSLCPEAAHSLVSRRLAAGAAAPHPPHPVPPQFHRRIRPPSHAAATPGP